MSINILTYKITIEILYKLLYENCFIKTDKYYELNIETYKKILINNQLQPFLDEVKKYYKKQKQYYITREQKHVYFLTIIRHICNSNNIKYTSSIYYDHSKHQIKYYIFFE